MPAPAITSQALNDYAITTEEVTIATCNVSNTPTYVIVIINGYPFRMSKYATVSLTVDTYRVELYGYQIGVCSAQTAYFTASNASGGATIATATSTLTVTRPTRTTYNIDRVIDRLVYLCQHPSEYGGNKLLETFEVSKDWEDGFMTPGPNGWLLKKPVCWIHSIKEGDESGGIGNLYNLVVQIQFSIFIPLTDTTSTQSFYDADSEIRYMIQENPDLQVSGNAFDIESSKVVQTKFPNWNAGYYTGQMDIDVEFKIDQRS